MLPNNISFAAIVGSLTVIFAILVKIIGLPHQIKQNYRRQSTEGLSLTYFVLSFLSYIFWTLHGILKKDSVVISGQFMGVVTTGIILYQIWLYHPSK